MRRIFVDANVINDIFDANRPFHEASFACLQACLQSKLNLGGEPCKRFMPFQGLKFLP